MQVLTLKLQKQSVFEFVGFVHVRRPENYALGNYKLRLHASIDSWLSIHGILFVLQLGESFGEFLPAGKYMAMELDCRLLYVGVISAVLTCLVQF